MKHGLKELVFGVAERSGAGRAARWLHRRDLRIVTYHGVDAAHDDVVNYDRLQTDPDLFRRQVEALARRYRVRPLGELMAETEEGAPWPERTLAITFDDGYRNNLEVAAPLLRQIGVPATFFVAHDYLAGRDYPWWYELRAALAGTSRADVEAPEGTARMPLRTVGDRVHAAQRWEGALVRAPVVVRRPRLAALLALLGQLPEHPYPLMTPVEARRLAAGGFELGTHTVRHLSCRHEAPEEVLADLEQSMHELVALGVQRPPVLAYPYGHVPEDLEPLRAALQAWGVVAAVTTDMGGNLPTADRYRLRRFDINGNRTVGNVLALVGGLLRPR